MNLIHVPRSTQVTAQSSLILMAERSGSLPVFPWSPSAASGPHSAIGNSVRPRFYLHTPYTQFHTGFCFLPRLSWEVRHSPLSSLILQIYMRIWVSFSRFQFGIKKKGQNSFFRISSYLHVHCFVTQFSPQPRKYFLLFLDFLIIKGCKYIQK